MKREVVLIILLLIPLYLTSEDSLINNSMNLHELLDEVKIIHEDDSLRYRLLIYRRGYEHVTGYLIIQKYSVNHDGSSTPYKLLKSATINEINKIYNFKIKSVTRLVNGFNIILNATHSYSYENTTIEISITDDLSYEINSGLVDKL